MRNETFWIARRAPLQFVVSPLGGSLISRLVYERFRLKAGLQTKRGRGPSPMIAFGVFAVAIAGARLSAEDLIDRKGGTTPLRGDVTEISRTEVLLKGRNIQREYRI